MITKISDRQLEIIDAAGKILTTSGVGGLTIKNLAKEMKFSESAIYRHFASKEEIIVEMLNHLAETMNERLLQVIQSTASPEDKFTLLFQNQFTFFNDNSHFVVAVFSEGLMEESRTINEAILNLMNVKLKHLFPLLKEGQQKGIFTNALSTDELVHIIMGTFRLQMLKWRLTHFQDDIQKSGNKLIHSVLTLIKAK